MARGSFKLDRSKSVRKGPRINPVMVVQRKEFFLDRDVVRQQIKDSGQSPSKMMRAGSYVRKVMRNSIKVRKRKYSEPGNPPHARASTSQMKRIAFQWDPVLQSMLVGSVYYHSKYGTPVPAVHEKGGVINVTIRKRLRKRKQKVSRKLQKALRRRIKAGKPVISKKAEYVSVPVQYDKRPFAAPALKASTPKLLQIFKASIVPAPLTGSP